MGLDAVDFGDIDVMHTDLKETHRRVEQVSTELCAADAVPLAIGGDHGLTYPLAKGLCNSVNGNIGVICFDAHPNLRLSRHGEISSGTSFRRLLDELPAGQVRPQNMAAVGINGWQNSKVWLDYERDIGMNMVTARDIHLRGVHLVIEEVIAQATDGVRTVYLSVDINCLDAAYAPGTNVPGQGGLTSIQLLEAVLRIGMKPLVRRFDIMEIAPPLDSENVTSFIGMSILMQFLGAVKSRGAETKVH